MEIRKSTYGCLWGDASSATNSSIFCSIWSRTRRKAVNFSAYPPLELRGALTPYQVDIHEPRNKALIQRFEANPNDRLVTAARHLFRTQFADVFSSPWDQDYASYCTCLEAALNIGEEDQEEDQGQERAGRCVMKQGKMS